jgi:uncharacterized membrane protein YccF (DUF307 family)
MGLRSAARDDAPDPGRDRTRSALSAGKHWAGYGWFMSFGTLLPLVVFLGSYLLRITFVGIPIARRLDRFGIWLSTFGQEPPGKEKLEARQAKSDKEPFVERVRAHSPPGYLERRGRPVAMPLRVVWFVCVGWWLGALWVLVSWSVFLLPYPLLDTVRALLGELPSVMTLSYPEGAPAGQ